MSELVITGIGVSSAIGQGQAAFTAALLQGASAFGVLKRPGRQWPLADAAGLGDAKPFIGAEISALQMPDALPRKALRTASWSSQVAAATLHEAWHDAGLSQVSPERIGLVVGGSNFQQRELAQLHAAYRGQPFFLKPSYGHVFMDTDLCGLCTELFGIRGFAYTLGAASASGQMAVLQAMDAVRCGRVDVCIAVGALMDLSCWELQAFRSMGAMGSERFADQPEQACRPFDAQRDGFIYGESCGVVVVERADRINRSGVSVYAQCGGSAMAVDANRNPNPSLEGEMTVIQGALRSAGLAADQIDYVNPHGTASLVGDEIELAALRRCGLGGAYLNATKSVTGHGLSAAGIVEIIATLVQMKTGRLHPTCNLQVPIDDTLNWVKNEALDCKVRHALTMSIGFGGINSALCLLRA